MVIHEHYRPLKRLVGFFLWVHCWFKICLMIEVGCFSWKSSGRQCWLVAWRVSIIILQGLNIVFNVWTSIRSLILIVPLCKRFHPELILLDSPVAFTILGKQYSLLSWRFILVEAFWRNYLFVIKAIVFRSDRRSQWLIEFVGIAWWYGVFGSKRLLILSLKSTSRTVSHLLFIAWLVSCYFWVLFYKIFSFLVVLIVAADGPLIAVVRNLLI